MTFDSAASRVTGSAAVAARAVAGRSGGSRAVVWSTLGADPVAVTVWPCRRRGRGRAVRVGRPGVEVPLRTSSVIADGGTVSDCTLGLGAVDRPAPGGTPRPPPVPHQARQAPGPAGRHRRAAREPARWLSCSESVPSRAWGPGAAAGFRRRRLGQAEVMVVGDVSSDHADRKVLSRAGSISVSRTGPCAGPAPVSTADP